MSTKFEIYGTVKYPVKGIGLKVDEQDGKYRTTHEVLCFDRNLYAGLDVGSTIRVVGRLGAKKSEYVREYNGKQYAVWLCQLIATAILPWDGVTQPGADQTSSQRVPATSGTRSAINAKLAGGTDPKKPVPGESLYGADDIDF